MARTYKRDSRGRFAGGGGSSRGGGRKPLQRGTNRLTRDNAGRITSVGGDGATARGGRLRTASGRQRATVTARGIGKAPAGTVGKSGRVKGAARVKAKAATARPKASASQLGSRLNPAKKSIRAATRKADKAYARENRIRSSLFSGNKSTQTRTAIAKELDKASNLTATMRQQVREVRAQFPVQTRDGARRAVGSRRTGTISQTKEVRNATNRREAFKRKVTRAASISRPGNDKRARQSARTRAQAMATYQGARRPSETDRTVGQFGRGRVSTAFKAPSSRIPAPSRSARRQGRAMALAQTQIRDQFGRRTGNPVKQQRKRRTGQKAVKFYQNPTAAVRELMQDRGKRGLPVQGFRLPRSQRANTAAKPAAAAKPARKLGFTQSDFTRRSQRTASIRNPQVKAKAQQLYGKILDLNSTPRQLKSMFKKAGKPKQKTATAATRQMRREHQNMMAASKVLFK